MAELAFPLASKLIEKLGALASVEICLAWGVEAELQKLEHTISTIKDVLLDAQEKQAHNQQVSSWLRQLRDVFLDAEDLLDEFECEALRRQVVETFHGTSTKVRRSFSRANPIAFRLRLGHHITEIRSRLDELKANKAFHDLHTDYHHHHRGDRVRENETHSFVLASKVIGRKYEKEAITDLLMQQGGDDQSGNGNIPVIPIVGMGGLGKTTLAQSVYNDQRVVGHFDLRLWKYVSVDFDVIRLARELLSSASGTKISDKLSMDQLQEKLRGALKDKKFLLVLDDVWNEDRIKWIQLRDLLTAGTKFGSKILVTTRNISVASIMGTIPENINLRVLSFEDCLSLFVECAFGEGREKQHGNLFEIGKDIVRKCGGVPLAVKTLGSQLYSKTDEREWKLIRDSEIWQLERDGAGHILPALRLSYTQLPSHLRECLAACSYLRKDRNQFYSVDLICYWMAHGILQSGDHGNMELEDVGELYFKELWARSFFENVLDKCESTYKFDMHDLIHDLAQSAAQGEFFTVDSAGIKEISQNVRHLTILKVDQNASTTMQEWNKVRTVAADTVDIDESFLHTCFSRFKYLRVLRLFRASFKVLPSSIGTLKHLRYLNLTCEVITKLPNAICKLQSLQTLWLHNCKNLEELPREIRKLISLRWLSIFTKQTSFPDNGVGCLKSLRRLDIANCSNLTSLPREMSYFEALRCLGIYNCKQLDLANENYQVIPLMRLQKLYIVKVPRTLELPAWFQGAAKTLQVLYIERCHNLAALPEWLTSFASLGKLYLKSCKKLLSLPESMHYLTALRELHIANCPQLESRCQPDIGEDWPKISHVPHVYISEVEVSSTVI